jgi:hypothetical protein
MRVGGWARKHRWRLGAAGGLLGVLAAFWVLLGAPWPRGWPSSIDEVRMRFAPYPRLWINSDYGNCGSNHVIDADGRGWHESGCEARSSGWRRGEGMDSARLEKFRRALAEFSKVPDMALGEQHCKSVKYQGALRISLQLDERRARAWWTCADPAERPPELERLWQSIYGSGSGS